MTWLAYSSYALLQLIAFLMMGLDKSRAKKASRKRIAEKTLWLVSWLGGAVGMCLGMYRFHHKTRKAVFRYGLPLLAIAQVALIIYFLAHFI